MTTKADARRIARLEEENRILREQQQRYAGVNISLVREVAAFRIAFREIREAIDAAEEMAR